MKPPRTFPAAAWVGGRSVKDPRLSPDATKVSFIHASELTLLDVTGGRQSSLPFCPKAKSYCWRPDGTGFIYGGTDGRVYAFDLATSSCELISSNAEYEISP